MPTVYSRKYKRRRRGIKVNDVSIVHDINRSIRGQPLFGGTSGIIAKGGTGVAVSATPSIDPLLYLQQNHVDGSGDEYPQFLAGQCLNMTYTDWFTPLLQPILNKLNAARIQANLPQLQIDYDASDWMSVYQASVDGTGSQYVNVPSLVTGLNTTGKFGTNGKLAQEWRVGGLNNVQQSFDYLMYYSQVVNTTAYNFLQFVLGPTCTHIGIGFLLYPSSLKPSKHSVFRWVATNGHDIPTLPSLMPSFLNYSCEQYLGQTASQIIQNDADKIDQAAALTFAQGYSNVGQVFGPNFACPVTHGMIQTAFTPVMDAINVMRAQILPIASPPLVWSDNICSALSKRLSENMKSANKDIKLSTDLCGAGNSDKFSIYLKNNSNYSFPTNALMWSIATLGPMDGWQFFLQKVVIGSSVNNHYAPSQRDLAHMLSPLVTHMGGSGAGGAFTDVSDVSYYGFSGSDVALPDATFRPELPSTFTICPFVIPSYPNIERAEEIATFNSYVLTTSPNALLPMACPTSYNLIKTTYAELLLSINDVRSQAGLTDLIWSDNLSWVALTELDVNKFTLGITFAPEAAVNTSNFTGYVPGSAFSYSMNDVAGSTLGIDGFFNGFMTSNAWGNVNPRISQTTGYDFINDLMDKDLSHIGIGSRDDGVNEYRATMIFAKSSIVNADIVPAPLVPVSMRLCPMASAPTSGAFLIDPANEPPLDASININPLLCSQCPVTYQMLSDHAIPTITEINRYRNDRGMTPLAWSDNLAYVAFNHAFYLNYITFDVAYTNYVGTAIGHNYIGEPLGDTFALRAANTANNFGGWVNSEGVSWANNNQGSGEYMFNSFKNEWISDTNAGHFNPYVNHTQTNVQNFTHIGIGVSMGKCSDTTNQDVMCVIYGTETSLGTGNATPPPAIHTHNPNITLCPA